MKILKGLENNKQFWFVVFSTFLFFILRFPSLFEPLWYGDEGIYQVIGTSLNHGKLLYSQIFDNKPPLLYWLYSVFHSDQFTIRLVSLIFGAISIGIFFLLSKKLFINKKNNNIPYLTTLIFAVLFGLPTLEGNIANAENFMLLPIIISAFLITTQKKLFIAGLLLGVAFLFKIVAIFDFSAFIIFCFILNIDSLKKEIRLSSIIIGFFLPIFLVSLNFLFNGTFIDFIKAAFIANISYVSYGNKIGALPFLLFIKLILLGGCILFLFTKRKKNHITVNFISIWFAFSLFNAYFSQRPYIHYLLVLIPSLSLMAGAVLFDRKYQKVIALIFLISLSVVIRGFGFSRFDKGIGYYQNFISYVMGQRTMTSYQAFFDQDTPSDYEIARFIKPKLNKNDTIFVWGNNPQLYQLVGVVAPTKYVVAYHISNYKDGPATTKQGLDQTKPKFIVIMASNNSIPFSLINYSRIININNATIYERIF